MDKGRIIFIAVKPQYVKVVLEEVKSLLTPDHVIVSIAAGVPLAVLKVPPPPPPHPVHPCYASRAALHVASCNTRCVCHVLSQHINSSIALLQRYNISWLSFVQLVLGSPPGRREVICKGALLRES